MKLTNAEIGKNYIVEYIDTSDVSVLKKICSMGILPGTEITVIKNRAGILFNVYHSRFVIDNFLGEKIYVKDI